MTRKNRKAISIIAFILALLMIVGMVVVPAVTASATTLSDLQEKYKELESKQKKVEAQIKANKNKQSDATEEAQNIEENIGLISDQIDNVNDQISSLNDDISGLNDKIDTLNAKISKLNTEIDAKEQLIKETQASIDSNYELFKERLVALYKTGDYSYLDVLLSSSDITDYLYKTQLLKSVTKYDTDLINTLKTELQTVKDAKAGLEADQADLESDKGDLETAKADVEVKKADQKEKKATLVAKQKDLEGSYSDELDLIGSIKDDTATLKELNEKLEEQMDEADKEIEELAKNSSSGTTYSGGDFLWPIQNFATKISSPFGYRYHPITGQYKLHAGIDIIGKNSSIAKHAIVAANSGTVKFSGNTGSGYGNYIIIDHGGGVMTLYGHCYKLVAKTGQTVSRGQLIAYVGESGLATGYHLHFGVLVNGSYVNPLKYTYDGRIQ